MPDAIPTPNPVAAKPRRPIFRALRVASLAIVSISVALGIAYGVLCWWYYSQEVRLTRNFAAELNAPILKVPEEQRAITHYRRALEMLEPAEEGESADSPVEGNWLKTAEYLQRNASALGRIRDAAKMRPFGAILYDGVQPADVAWQLRHQCILETHTSSARPPSDNPTLGSVPLQHYGPILWAARLLQADARLAATENDASRLLEDLQAMLDVGDQAAEGPFPTDGQLARICAGMAHETIRRILVDRPDAFSDEGLSSLALRLQASIDDGLFDRRLVGERLIYLDYIQRYYTSDETGDGVFAIDGDTSDRARAFRAQDREWQGGLWDRLRAPVWARFILPSRRELERQTETCFDEVDRIFALPAWKRRQALSDFKARPVLYETLQAWNFPAIEPADLVPLLHNGEVRFRSELGATLIAITLTRYRRAHDKWPVSLAELIPMLLKEIPRDQFTGEPLRYRLRDGRPEIYSVGSDLDDDGGNPPDSEDDLLGSEIREFDADRPAPNGDWILWPPEPEHPEEQEAAEVEQDAEVDEQTDAVPIKVSVEPTVPDEPTQ